ncbi:hypothetical protein CapIbe_012342 [Capra ibex]
MGTQWTVQRAYPAWLSRDPAILLLTGPARRRSLGNKNAESPGPRAPSPRRRSWRTDCSEVKVKRFPGCKQHGNWYDAASCVLPLEQLVFCAEIISGNSSTRFQRSREAKAIGGGSKAKTLLSE